MPAINLSAPDWCFFRDHLDADAYYRRLAEQGVTGVEMVDPRRWDAARRAGLAITNLPAPGMTRGLNRRELHAEILPEIREAIALAQANAIPAVIVFSGNREGLDDATGVANCVAGLRQLAPVAEAAGVTLLFEMLCAMNHPDYQADRSAFGFSVVRAVASPAVKALYDIYHMFRMGDDVLGDIVHHLDLIGHLHVAESPRRSIPVPGGEIPYATLVPAVLQAGYTGYWGLEFIPQGDPLAEIADASARFRAWAG